MLRALIFICAATAAPQVSDCTADTAYDVVVTTIESGNPATCYMQAQAFVAQTGLRARIAPDDRINIQCRPIARRP